MEVDIEEDKNEPELTSLMKAVGILLTVPTAYDSEHEDVLILWTCDGLLPGLMRRDINSLFGRMTSLSRRLCGRETAHALVKKKSKAKGEYYGKLILDLGNEVRSSVEEGTTAMKNLNERVKRDLYWTRVQAHEFYREMIRRGFVFKERPNEAIDISVEDEESPSSEIMPPKSAPFTQVAVRRMIKESVDAPIAAERARHANAGNNASRSRPARGQVTAPVV
ncbi:hypothetical protein Tco_0699262 [Tanacetum coccineum]